MDEAETALLGRSILDQVIRSFFAFFNDWPAQRAEAERVGAWLQSVVPTNNHYRAVPAPWTDTAWDNIPEPHLHWYGVPEGGRPMQVGRRHVP